MNPRVLSAVRHVGIIAIAGAALSAGTRARGGDIHDLQRGLPLEVEDTTTTEKRQMQLQVSSRYQLEDNGDDMLFVDPQLQYGFADNFHVEVTYPIIAGSGDRTGAGDVIVAGLYRFLDEKHPGFGGDDPWPSLAIKGQVELPTGEHSDGLDTLIRFIATKTITEASSQDRVHVNVDWAHNAAAPSSERENRFALVLGYSRKLDNKTVVLADLIREQERREGEDSTILEAGVMRQVTDQITISGGLGFGLGEDSPDFRATFGFQYSF
jgi:hypothetical protein